MISFKKILLIFFRRENLFFKIIIILKNFIIIFKRIGEINIKLAILLSNKIICGQVTYEKLFKLKEINKKKKYFENKYVFFYEDWFFHNINIWEKFLKQLDSIDYLEIGSFEGRSTVFISENKKTKSLTAVDTWTGSDEHKNIDFKRVFSNFKKNILKTKKKIKFYKKKSQDFFKNNFKTFNLIYIDGSHHYEDVKHDLNYAIKFIKTKGYIICDDFLWSFYNKKNDNAMKAILECYEKNKKKLVIVYLNYQIIFKRI